MSAEHEKGRPIVSPRRSSWSPEEIALLVADYAAFVPVPEIAAKLGRGIATTEMRIHIYGLHRTQGVAKALKRAPERLKTQLGRVSDDEWLRLHREWRREQTKGAQDERQARVAERRARLAAGCQEIDSSDTSRNEKIAAKRALGMTLEEIAQQHGITRERVRQIVRYFTHPQSVRSQDKRRQWLNRLIAIWDACPSDARAAFLAKVGAPPDAGRDRTPLRS